VANKLEGRRVSDLLLVKIGLAIVAGLVLWILLTNMNQLD